MYSKSSRYSRSPSPYERRSDPRAVSRSRSISRSRSRSRDASIENPGNNLYVTGLSARVSKRDLEKHFSNEGKVEDIHLVIDPWTRETRGFGFVTMSTVEEADRCVKYLDRSVLEGRVITVERFFWQQVGSSSPKSIQLINQIKLNKQISDYYFRGLRGVEVGHQLQEGILG
ncbi:serine/arginine-rich splicing factor SR45a isoform X4 [Rhododendron vialii]|uniref:serine/arginine-rich splicing factor SR45a isoform X4 n=1 Tax=Rhododendron vialii TaxID=182163 RepID=UPI00265E616D|nr:serine/arginine-rich splicing factor SR45a isoform X4 [Rhododendron vialii]XP_058198931.1 serine/arginine-rich splicing factor SR45a isoform X4 [Rhododendron vialii]